MKNAISLHFFKGNTKMTILDNSQNSSNSQFFPIFAPMKKRLLQIGSLLMAFAVLFVSFGWDVCFHYCTSSHTMTSHIGMGSPMHAQCFGHAQCSEESHEHHPMATHFDAKGCCNDYDSKIQFTDNFVYSPEKQLIISLQYYLLSHLDLNDVLVQVRQIFYNHSPKKALKFLSGQERIVFFSSLKLNPLVFWFFVLADLRFACIEKGISNPHLNIAGLQIRQNRGASLHFVAATVWQPYKPSLNLEL